MRQAGVRHPLRPERATVRSLPIDSSQGQEWRERTCSGWNLFYIQEHLLQQEKGYHVGWGLARGHGEEGMKR